MTALQVLAVIGFSPLLHGWIQTLKARMQGRQGPSIWQPYRNLRKYLIKSMVLSTSSSWITQLAPYVIFGLIATACAMLPVASATSSWLLTGGSIFAFLYVLAFARFATILLGLDSGSAFAGIGAGRDLLFTILAEPTIFLALLAVGLPNTTFSFPGMIVHSHPVASIPVTVLVLAALFLVLIVETGRLPVDNPDTHLELTMVHEGMLLDLTGRHLALVSLSAYIRQTLWFTVLLDVCLPWGIANGTGAWSILLGFVLWTGKCLLLGILVAGVESVSAKLRIFVVPRYLSFALTLAVAAVLADAVL